MFKTLIGKCA